MRKMKWICVLSVVYVLLGGAGAWGATNPVTGTTLERQVEGGGARPSLFLGVGRAILMLQTTLNRDIGRRMRAIRDGDSHMSVVAGLAFAFLYGVLHTLGPGHGKFVVASYFISRQARLWRGLLMGLQISVTHVISALGLLWLANASVKTILGGSPAGMRGVQMVSYGTTAAIGLVMLIKAVQRSLPRPVAGTSREDGHREHCCGKQLGLMSFSVGLVPCTGAVLVMLFALANNMVFTGTVMVAAIAAGMAVTMSVLGVFSILVRGALLSRAQSASHTHSATALVLEYAGALIILIVSSVLFVGVL